MIAELFLATPGSGVLLEGFMNTDILNFPDIVKIGLMAVIAIVLVKWALITMNQTSLAEYI